MNANSLKPLIAAATILLAAGSAFAQQTEFVAADAGFVSSKSRADVVAELNQAYADGTVGTMTRDGADGVMLAAGNRSRADVRAEASQIRQAPFTSSLYFGS